MTAINEVEKFWSSLSKSDKAKVAQWAVLDLVDSYPGIENKEGVMGGVPCIVRTRIPVWLLVQAKKMGANDAKILEAYPNLRAEDLVSAWGYYRTHKEEIDVNIKKNEEA